MKKNSVISKIGIFLLLLTGIHGSIMCMNDFNSYFYNSGQNTNQYSQNNQNSNPQSYNAPNNNNNNPINFYPAPQVHPFILNIQQPQVTPNFQVNPPLYQQTNRETETISIDEKINGLSMTNQNYIADEGEKLIKAIKENSLVKVEKIIEKTKKEKPNLMSYLLNVKHLVNGFSRLRPLHTAIKVALDKKIENPLIITFLLKNGVDTETKSRNGLKALEYAISITANSKRANMAAKTMAILLLKNGAKVDAPDCIALHKASDKGNLELVKLLVEKYGANIHLKDSEGAKAIHYAAKSGHMETFEHLLQEENIIRDDSLFFDNYKNTHDLILKRCSPESKNFIKEYFTIPFTKNSDSIAHFLICSKKITFIEKIIKKYGINLNHINSSGKSPTDLSGNAELVCKKLDLLASKGSEITIKIKDGDSRIEIEELDFMVKNGINLNNLNRPMWEIPTAKLLIDQGIKTTITLNSTKNEMKVYQGSKPLGSRTFKLNDPYQASLRNLFFNTFQACQELNNNSANVSKYLTCYLYLKDENLITKKVKEIVKKEITIENPDIQYQDYKELQESTLADTYLAKLINALQKTKENIRRKRNSQMGIETIAPMHDKIIALNKLANLRKHLYRISISDLNNAITRKLVEKEDIESIVFSYDLLKDKQYGPLRKLISKEFNHYKDANGHTIYQAMANYKEYLPYLMCKDYFAYFLSPNLKESLFQKILWGDIKKDEKDLVIRKINSKICHLQNEYKYIRKNKKYYSRIKSDRSYLNNKYHKTFVNTGTLFFLLANCRIPLYEKDPKTNKKRKKDSIAVINPEIAAEILKFWNGELDEKSYFVKPA
ncbi:ankyrin repeat domain-containing protein [Candidatus Dependentiae bacterium]